MRTGSCAGCGHRKKLYGDRCVGCLSTGAHGDARPGRQPPPWTDVGGGRVNARPSNPMREAQEHEAFDRHLASLPKLLCGCSVGTGCDGAHARRPAKHGDSAKLSVADAYQLRILKDTVRNPLKGQFLGGPSAEEAEETLRSKFRFTSEQIRNLKGGARHGETSSRGGEERHDYEHRGAPFVVGTDTRGDRTRWLYWIKGMAGAGPYFSTRGAAVTGAKKRIDAALDKEWPGIFRPDVGSSRPTRRPRHGNATIYRSVRQLPPGAESAVPHSEAKAMVWYLPFLDTPYDVATGFVGTVEIGFPSVSDATQFFKRAVASGNIEQAELRVDAPKHPRGKLVDEYTHGREYS